jgi:hypothetical protein
LIPIMPKGKKNGLPGHCHIFAMIRPIKHLPERAIKLPGLTMALTSVHKMC